MYELRARLRWPGGVEAVISDGLAALRKFKVLLMLKPVANAPQLKMNKFTVEGTKSFQHVEDSLKKMLGRETVYLYIQQSFTPEPTESVADLYNAFKGPGNALVISYSLEPAYS